MEELLKLAKQCLSIVETVTIKDAEIKMNINAGKLDMISKGIDVEKNIRNDLIRSALIMFVKSNFGNTDIKDKELARKTYELLLNNLMFDSEYKIKEVQDD